MTGAWHCMTDSIEQIDALARRFFDSIEAGDIDGVSACYADSVEVWHNTDRKTEGKAQNLKVLQGFIGHISGIRYEQRRLSPFQGGFVQQHLLRGRRPDGENVELPAAIICSVVAGKITRLDEYFDSAQVAAFVGR